MKKIKNNHDNQLTYSFINKPNKRLITRRPYESLNTVTTRIEIKKKKEINKIRLIEPRAKAL